MRKDELARPALRRHDQQGDHDDDDAGAGPVDANLVDEIEVARAKGVDEGAHEHDGPEAQDGLPGVCDKVLVEDGDGAEDELGAREVDGQRDGPVAHERQPAVDEADERCPFATAEHGRPVVDASGRGVDGANLGERPRDAQRDERHEDPAVENRHRLSVGKRNVHGCREPERHRHDGKREAENAEHAEVARQFCLVAQTGERLVGIVAAGAGHAVTTIRNSHSFCLSEFCFLWSRGGGQDRQPGLRRQLREGKKKLSVTTKPRKKLGNMFPQNKKKSRGARLKYLQN